MEHISQFPFFSVQFNKDAVVVQRAEVDALLTYLTEHQHANTPVTDLIVLSHGWNNDLNDAQEKYRQWLTHTRAVLDAGHVPDLEDKRFVVMGVFWPSKKFADSELIAGGAASIGESNPLEEALKQQIEDLIAAASTPSATILLNQAEILIPDLEDNETARHRFVELVRAVLPPETPSGDQTQEDAQDTFLSIESEEVLERLSTASIESDSPEDESEGGALGGIGGLNGEDFEAGSAAGRIGDFFGNIFGSVRAGARNLLNITTYYLMKTRAGQIGSAGVYPVLREVTATAPALRLHLIGHSFGGRLVASTALGPAGGMPLPVASMTLLQAAFSHNGFGEDYDGQGHDGFFRKIITQRRMTGPIVITHTVNDKAVGLAYLLASRLNQDSGTNLGDANDLYGGIGRNGAQHTPGAAFLAMQAVGQKYGFQASGIYNLNADQFLKDHSDLEHDEVAYAFLSAMAAGIGEQNTPNREEAGVLTAANENEGSAAGMHPDSMDEITTAPQPQGTAASVPPSVPIREGTASEQQQQTKQEKERQRLQSNLDSSVIAIPLLEKINAVEERTKEREPVKINAPGAEEQDADIFDVIIDVNLNYSGVDPRSQNVTTDSALPDSSRERAKAQIRHLLQSIIQGNKRGLGVYERKSRLSQQYLFARLDADTIKKLVLFDNNPAARTLDRTTPATGHENSVDSEVLLTRAPPPHRAVYHIWEDASLQPLLSQSLSTVKANAAHAAFGALGEGIVWAVMDSGIDKNHRHFAGYQNLDLPDPLRHSDFSGLKETPNASPADNKAHTTFDATNEASNVEQALTDDFGHGTHVAGIIAGALPVPENLHKSDEKETKDHQDKTDPIVAVSRQRATSDTSLNNIYLQEVAVARISGVAPLCKVISLKVLDNRGQGKVSNIIAAINYVQEVNGYGRRIQIHGVNLSVGYTFDPEWFACGQSPLCVEVDRLVRSGVVVVVAAGNTGYGVTNSQDKGNVSSSLALSINDPGNAELAITVGSTHREMPHIYGVSYFSSKGPTGDGRLKPDLVAPGEKILSCAAGQSLAKAVSGLKKQRARKSETAGQPGTVEASSEENKHEENIRCDYVEQSGTSMAAPHVSGAIAAFLSVRREFCGRPEQVKEIFLSTATDLKRQREFQGHGLIDLMRAIQSV